VLAVTHEQDYLAPKALQRDELCVRLSCADSAVPNAPVCFSYDHLETFQLTTPKCCLSTCLHMCVLVKVEEQLDNGEQTFR
jgi:hypothetical protein